MGLMWHMTLGQVSVAAEQMTVLTLASLGETHFLAPSSYIPRFRNSWARRPGPRGATGCGEPVAFYLGTLMWMSNVRTHWSHSLLGATTCPVRMEHWDCLGTFNPRPGSPPAITSPKTLLSLPALNISVHKDRRGEGSSPCLREAPV